jgi:hypothetical protein
VHLASRLFPVARAVLCLAAAGLWSRPSAADSHRTSSLSWVELPGAEGCGGATTIAHAIEERLGRAAIVSPVDAELSIEAYAERSGRPPLWHAVVRVRTREGVLLGSRELASAADDCSELRAAVVLVAALMIDPDAARRPAGPPAHEVSSPPPVPVPAPAPAPAAACPPLPDPPPPQVVVQRVEVPVAAGPRSQAWTAEPSASAALGFGVLPSTAPGARVGLAVGPRRSWSIEAFAKLWASQSVAVEQGAQVRFSLADAGAAFCPLSFGSARLPTLTACLGAEVGLLQSESQGFVNPQDSLEPTVRLVAPASLSLPVAMGVSVRLGAELDFALVRDHYVYSDASKAPHVLWEPLVSGEADLGLAISVR